MDDPEVKELAADLCRIFGATDDQLAQVFKVTEQTVNNWKKADPEFFESLKGNKAKADNLVETALFRRATGFMRTRETLDKFGTPVALQEEIAPDTTAIIFWLKNRRPEEWRDKQEHEHSGKIESITVNVTRKEPPK